jgi:hypothetical protein
MNALIGDYYNLGAVNCRKILHEGGVCIFVFIALVLNSLYVVT